MSRPLYISDSVHFVHSGRVCRAAIITQMETPGNELANLAVIYDGPDYPTMEKPGKTLLPGINRFVWAYKVRHSPTMMENTWHTASECPHIKQYQEAQKAPQPLISEKGNQPEHPIINPIPLIGRKLTSKSDKLEDNYPDAERRGTNPADQDW